MNFHSSIAAFFLGAGAGLLMVAVVGAVWWAIYW